MTAPAESAPPTPPATTAPAGGYRNRLGRRPTRGLRPWLLLPKVICVGLYLGGLAAAQVIWWRADLASPDLTTAQRLLVLDQIRALFTMLLVPALLAAIGLGIALLLQHPLILIRLRWLLLKLVLLAVLVPSAHLYMSSRVAQVRQAVRADQIPPAGLVAQVQRGMAAAMAGFVVVAILGRLKPRLGQNWAKSFPARSANDQAPMTTQ